MTVYKPTENEEYMNDSMLSYFKNKLSEECGALVESIAAHKAIATQTSNAVDPIDQASVEEERNFSDVSRSRETLKLKACRAAINKITLDDFGFCDDCGKEIGVGRLLFNPSLPFCVGCAEAAEARGKHYAK